MSVKKRKLDQYSGMLNFAEVANGINAAFANARRLMADAKLLLENQRYPSAAALAILAIEESGKPRMLRMLAMMDSAKDCEPHWKEYRCHTKKNAHYIFLESATKGRMKLADFRHMFEDDAQHPFLLEQLKQVALYTDCFQNRNWSIPEKVIDNDLAAKLVCLAEYLSNHEDVSSTEVELWVKHLKPVWGKSLEAMQTALVEFCRNAKGSKTADEMKTFIENGISVLQPDMPTVVSGDAHEAV